MNFLKFDLKRFVPSALSSGEEGEDSNKQSITTTRFRPCSSRASSSSELKSLSANSYLKKISIDENFTFNCKRTLTGRIRRFLAESKLIDEIND